MDMLYFGDGVVPYNYHHHHHHHNYGQVNPPPHCKYEFVGCGGHHAEFPPPSCAYAPGGLGPQGPEGGGGGMGDPPPPPAPHNFLRTPLGPYHHNPFQQMSAGSYMGLFQRRPGRIKGIIIYLFLVGL